MLDTLVMNIGQRAVNLSQDFPDVRFLNASRQLLANDRPQIAFCRIFQQLIPKLFRLAIVDQIDDVLFGAGADPFENLRLRPKTRTVAL